MEDTEEKSVLRDVVEAGAIAAESFLSYLWLAVWMEHLQHMFFFSLLVTGAAVSSFLYGLAWLLGIAVVAPRAVRLFCGRYADLLRLALPACVVLHRVVDPVARSVVLALGGTLGWVVVACFNSAEVEVLHAHRRRRFNYGFVGSLVWSHAMRVAGLTFSPLWLSLGAQVTFAMLGVAACLYLAYFPWREQLVRHDAISQDAAVQMTTLALANTGATTTATDSHYNTNNDHEAEAAAAGDLALKVDGGGANRNSLERLTDADYQLISSRLGKHRFWAWIPLAVALASLLMITISFGISGSSIARWAGVYSFPASMAPLILLLFGVATAPVFSKTPYFFPFMFLGTVLHLHGGAGGASFIGLCLVVMVLPWAWLAFLQEEVHLHFAWPVYFGGFVLFIIWWLAYFGIIAGAISPLGGPFEQNGRALFWPVYMLLLFLVVASLLRIVLVETGEGKWADYLKPKVRSDIGGMFQLTRALAFWLAALALIIVIAVVVRGGIAGAGAAQRDAFSPDKRELRVLSYNTFLGMQLDGFHSVQGVANITRTFDIDVVGGQETETSWNFSSGDDAMMYIATTQGYHLNHGMSAGAARRYTFGTSILSRFPLETERWAFLFLPSQQECRGCQGRGVAMSDVLVGGTLVRIISAHIEFADDGVQDKQAAEVLALLDDFEGGPAIVMGDFNNPPTSNMYSIMTQPAYGLRSAVATAQGADQLTFHKCVNGECSDQILDYIFYRGFDVLDAKVLTKEGENLSDHLPVFAHLRLQ